MVLDGPVLLDGGAEPIGFVIVIDAYDLIHIIHVHMVLFEAVAAPNGRAQAFLETAPCLSTLSNAQEQLQPKPKVGWLEPVTPLQQLVQENYHN